MLKCLSVLSKCSVAVTTHRVPVCTERACSKSSRDWPRKHIQGNESECIFIILLLLWIRDVRILEFWVRVRFCKTKPSCVRVRTASDTANVVDNRQSTQQHCSFCQLPHKTNEDYCTPWKQCVNLLCSMSYKDISFILLLAGFVCSVCVTCEVCSIIITVELRHYGNRFFLSVSICIRIRIDIKNCVCVRRMLADAHSIQVCTSLLWILYVKG